MIPKGQPEGQRMIGATVQAPVWRAFPFRYTASVSPPGSDQLQCPCRGPVCPPSLGDPRMLGASLLRAAFSSRPRVPRLPKSHLPGTGEAFCSGRSTSYLQFHAFSVGACPPAIPPARRLRAPRGARATSPLTNTHLSLSGLSLSSLKMTRVTSSGGCCKN